MMLYFVGFDVAEPTREARCIRDWAAMVEGGMAEAQQDNQTILPLLPTLISSSLSPGRKRGNAAFRNLCPHTLATGQKSTLVNVQAFCSLIDCWRSRTMK